jgi:serine/threonine protein kinase
VARIGDHFGGYELEQLAGHRNLGVIYRARDERLGRTVALRLIPPEIAGDPVTRARLNREARALAALDHPNVPPVFEAGEHENTIFIASRWIDGTNLRELVRAQGPLEPQRAVRIVNQVASALEAAHVLGLIHRNVKPSKVLVTAADHAYLLDFGLARRAGDLTGLTVQEDLLATLNHVAPEHLDGRDADRRVDIYGLGCVLYEALTGDVPYPEPGAAAKMYAHVAAETPSVRAHRPEVSEQLDAVVRSAMAKDPAGRQQTAADFAVEAAAAVDLSAPPWVRPGALGQVIRRDERPDQRFAPPVYFLRRRRRLLRHGVFTVGMVVFLAAPVALLLALQAHT